jgi:hypothetical protein
MDDPRITSNELELQTFQWSTEHSLYPKRGVDGKMAQGFERHNEVCD